MNNLLNELNSLKSNLDNLPIMNLSDLDLNNTDLFIVDINNGFAKGGALYSPRIESLINPIVNFTKSVSKDIEKVIKSAGGSLLTNIEVFDVYTGVGVGIDKKSIAYSLTFSDMKKTLTDEEINGLMDKIIDAVSKKCSAELRK